MAEALEPDSSPGLLLWRSTLRWQRRITAALRPLDVTHVQFVLLTSAWWLDRRARTTPTQRELAEYAALDPMMTSQVVRVLERKGLVQRQRDPADARAFRVSVTDEGAALAVCAVAVVEAADREFFAAAPDDAALLAALRALGG